MHRILVLGGGGSSATSSSAFTTLDPTNKHANITLSGGNLIATRSGGDSFYAVKSVASFSSGKKHIEVKANLLSRSDALIVGIERTDQTGNLAYPGENSQGVGFQSNNFFYNNGGLYDSDNPGSFVQGDTFACEFDSDNNIFKIKVAGAGAYVSANYPAGIIGQPCHFKIGIYTTGEEIQVNFGDSAFLETPTATFVGLS